MNDIENKYIIIKIVEFRNAFIVPLLFIAVETTEADGETKPAVEEPKKEPAVVAWYR